MCDLPDTHVVYITYHLDVGETPFLVAVDFSERSIIVSIRGTLSLEVSGFYFIILSSVRGVGSFLKVGGHDKKLDYW